MPSEDDAFVAKPSSLGWLLTGIDNHAIALPAFQRPWKWNPEMVRDLIITVADRYPSGSLLTMPVTSSSKFGLKPFDDAGKELKNKPNLMVLDGQQRLTSLYQALFKTNGVRFGEVPNEKRYYFYIDIHVLISNLNGSFELDDSIFDKALFYVLEDKKKDNKKIRYIDLKPVYELTTEDNELDAGALPLNLLFDPDRLGRWRRIYLRKNCENNIDLHDKMDNVWEKLVQPWINRIKSYEFPEIRLRDDLPLDAICHIFEKVNSKGMSLDVFDLCTAILWAEECYLNIAWKDTKKAFEEYKILPMQPLSGTYFLQGISLVDSLNRKRAGQSERVAVACRKKDLMDLDSKTVKELWNPLVDGYKEASKFMMNEGILSRDILPYSTMIVPLSAILTYIKGRKGEVNLGAAWPKIKKWYWCSVFSQRYSGTSETYSAIDFEQVVNWVDGGIPPEAVRIFTFRSDILQEVTSIRNAIYKGVLCLLAQNGAKDFGGKGKLDVAIYTDTNQDHHHIFPTHALKNLRVKDPRANTIVNKTLIGAEVNRSIGGRKPSEYVKDWRNRLDISIFDENLRTHAIEPEILSNNDWDKFVEDRREKLRQMIETVCGGIFQPFTDSIDSTVQLEEEDENENGE